MKRVRDRQKVKEQEIGKDFPLRWAQACVRLNKNSRNRHFLKVEMELQRRENVQTK